MKHAVEMGSYIHFVLLDCFLFSTLLVHILVRKFSLKSFFPRSSEWMPFSLCVQVSHLYSVTGKVLHPQLQLSLEAFMGRLSC
jgi:hypothetical protein